MNESTKASQKKQVLDFLRPKKQAAKNDKITTASTPSDASAPQAASLLNQQGPEIIPGAFHQRGAAPAQQPSDTNNYDNGRGETESTHADSSQVEPGLMGTDNPPGGASNEMEDPESAVLVEAILVTQDFQMETRLMEIPSIAEAVAVDDTEMSSNFLRSRIGCCFAVCCISIIASLVVGLVVGLLITKNSGDAGSPAPESSNIAPSVTSAPTSVFESMDALALLDELNVTNSTAVDILQNKESSTSRAFLWLLGDGNLDQMESKEKIQQFALATLFYATNGEQWNSPTNWLNHRVKECSWQWNFYTGPFCDENGTVISLDATSMNLNSTLPHETVALLAPSLQRLMFPFNLLGGRIPTTIGELTMLNSLDLSYNRLSQSIPTGLTGISTLRELNLAFNMLTGRIPIGSGQGIQSFDVHSNMLTGELTAEIGLSGVENLNLSSNMIGGTQPTEIGTMTFLRKFDLSENRLRGSLPSQIGEWSWLERLNIGSNALSYSVPSELGLLQNLCFVNISRNGFSGTIPKDLNSLCFGRHSTTSGGSPFVTLRETLYPVYPVANTPSERSRFTDAVNLLITKRLASVNHSNFESIVTTMGRYSTTQISGTTVEIISEVIFEPGSSVPSPEALWEALWGDLLSDGGYNLSTEWFFEDENSPNQTQSFSVDWNRPGLVRLDFSHNNLSGNIPVDVFVRRSRVDHIDISYNSLSGSLAPERGSAKNMTVLRLAGNRLVGTVPDELGGMTKLSILDLCSNTTSGTLRGIRNMISLKRLNVSYNELEGGLDGLSSLWSLCELDVRHNSISGNLPVEITRICYRGPFEQPATASNTSSSIVNFRFTLDFGFHDYVDLRSPRDDEVNAVSEQVAIFLTIKLEEAFENFESLEIVSWNSFYFSENLELPVSLLFMANAKFRAGKIPTGQQIDEILSVADFDTFVTSFVGRSVESLFWDIDSMFALAGRVVYETNRTTPVRAAVYLDFSFNSFDGTIPSELGLLLNEPANYINLLGNNFSGSLPNELCPYVCNHKYNGERNGTGRVLAVDCSKVSCSCSC